METEIMTIETDSLKAEIAPIVQRANEIIINSPATHKEAGESLLTVKAKLKAIDDKFDPGIKKAYEAYKYAGNLKKDFVAAMHLLEAEQIYKQKILAYEFEEGRKQRLLEAEALKKAREAEDAAKKKADAEIKKGNVEKAQAIMESIPAPVLPPPVSKVNGISTRKSWKAEIIDANKVPREYMIPDMTMLNGIAKATKGAKVIPGVKFVEESTLVGRTR